MDLLRQAHLVPVAISIMGGDTVVKEAENHYKGPKRDLGGTMQSSCRPAGSRSGRGWRVARPARRRWAFKLTPQLDFCPFPVSNCKCSDLYKQHVLHS